MRPKLFLHYGMTVNRTVVLLMTEPCCTNKNKTVKVADQFSSGFYPLVGW